MNSIVFVVLAAILIGGAFYLVVPPILQHAVACVHPVFPDPRGKSGSTIFSQIVTLRFKPCVS